MLLVDSLLASEFSKATTRTAKSQLAKKLYDLAVKTKDDSAGAYALFTRSYHLAIESGDVDTMLLAVAGLHARFMNEDGVTRRVKAFVTLRSSDYPITTTKAIADNILPAIRDSLAAHRYEDAMALIEVGNAIELRLNDAALKTELSMAQKRVFELRAQFQRFHRALEKMKHAPDDQDANGIVGRYLALHDLQWVQAESHLIKSNDIQIRPLVTREFMQPQSTDERLQLADDWWELSSSLSDAEANQARGAAARWYKRVVAELSGLSQEKARARIREVESDHIMSAPIGMPPFDLENGLTDSVSEQRDYVKCNIFFRRWDSSKDALDASGKNWIDLNESKDVAATLKNAKMLLLTGSGSATQAKSISAEVIEQITTYVENGGKAIITGPAWPWVSKAYAGKPLDEYPLNIMGARMGFVIGDNYVSEIDQKKIHRQLRTTGVKSIAQKGWTASEVSAGKATPLIVDVDGRRIAVLLKYGKGKVIVAGHDGLISKNSAVLAGFLQLLDGE